MSSRSPLYPLLGLAVISLVWGYNWVVMKEALRFCGPFTFASLRALLGGTVLLVCLLASRRPLAPKSLWGPLLLGLFQTTGFVGLMSWALVAGAAGRTAVLSYTMPFWLLLFAWPILGERLRGIQWVAVILAMAGLALLLPFRGGARLLSASLPVAGGMCWALSAVWAKLLREWAEADLVALTAWTLILGGIPLLAIALVRDEGAVRWTPYFIGALAYNTLLASAVAWFLWLYVLRELPAGVAGLGTLLTPVVALAAAWLVLGEAPGVREGSGMLLILSGLAVLTGERLVAR